MSQMMSSPFVELPEFIVVFIALRLFGNVNKLLMFRWILILIIIWIIWVLVKTNIPNRKLMQFLCFQINSIERVLQPYFNNFCFRRREKKLEFVEEKKHRSRGTRKSKNR